MTRSTNTLTALVAVLLILVVDGGCDLSRIRTESLAQSEREFLRTQIASAVCSNDARLSRTEKLLSESGLEPKTEVFEEAKNVVAEVEGETSEEIIIGAHYDKTTLGCGVIDNWSGVVMLALLAQETKAAKPKKSYKFVAFGGEERDLKGSRAMAIEIADTGASRPCAMVNMDSFGFDRTWALESISDRPLLLLASDVERELGGSFSIRNYRGATSDSKAFQIIDVPAITFSGLGDDWRDYLHQESDKVENIDFSAVESSYIFLRTFLRRLDAIDCGEMKE